MVRVCISVEGPTEERFVQQLLVPYYSQRDIFISPVSINGAVSLARIKHEIEKLAHSFDFVTTLYDFYGFKGKSAEDSKQSLERAIKDTVKPEVRDKVVPYIQMYEFEGILFSNPESVGNVLGSEHIEWASGVLSEFQGNPELINDSPQTAPSKRFIANTHYKKTIDGPDIAKDTGLDVLRQSCSGFNQWIETIESFA